MTKGEMRNDMRARRRALAPDVRAAASARICDRLSSMELVAPMAVYLAAPEEIDLNAFIRDALARGMRLAAPRWDGQTYVLAELNGCWPTGLVAGPHAIQEPPSDARTVEASAVGTWIVPGLAFAEDGSRLGYGGGWYDRLMSHARPDARIIGVGHAFQLVPELPAERHDILLDAVITA